MKQIIPFKKEITFKSMITSITSISLDNTLKLINESLVSGDFVVSGSYKMTEASQIDEEFSYKIPVEIAIDQKYDCTNMTFEIDDFTYEIIDEEKLLVNIELLLDNLELKPSNQDQTTNEIREDELSLQDLFLETSGEEALDITTYDPKEIALKIEEEVNKDIAPKENTTSIFSAFKDTDETFSTYCVYIVREGDSVDKIITKYKVSKEKLEEYNNLNEIKIGDKIIIPNNNA